MQQGIGTEPGNGLGIAIFLAAALHAILVLGIGFKPGAEPAYTPQLEITLAQRRSELAPDDATHLAQFSQEGSGDEAPEANVSSAASAALAGASQEQAERVPREQPQTATPVTSSARSPRQLAARNPEAAATPGLRPEAERLRQELANLEAALEDQTRDYSNRPRVKRLTALATREAVDAAYLHDWRGRVEAVGNRYYPEASRRYGIYGSLRLLVVINHDGQLEDIQVLASSGFAVLDEAAIKIVRMAAPFAPFPADLRASTDKLEIIRTWQFEQNRLSSG
jgi:periplasmic protein TonB